MEQQAAQRRLVAILAADVVGYSRLMERDETGTHAALKALQDELFDPKIAEFGGRIVKLTGDGALVEFASVVNAMRCAVDIQQAMAGRNTALPEEGRIAFRLGVNLADVIVEGDDIYGGGVNVAARLEGLAEPGGICVSRTVFNHVRGKVDIGFEDLGDHKVKNMAEPIGVYRVRIPAVGDSAKATKMIAKPKLDLPDKPSLAVLPFDNLSDDLEQIYFSDGITDDVITELSRFRDLFVIARNSSFSYKGQAVRVQDVAADLAVRYVLEGSVRSAGDRIRITARLIDAKTGHHIWAEQYDRDLTDVFAIQDEIARTVATTVAGRLKVTAESRAARKPVENLKAYDYLLRGQSIVGDTEENNLRARQAFEKAIELDPTCSRAYAGVAQHHVIDWFSRWGDSVEHSFNQALAYATTAVKLDDADSKSQWVLGHIHAFGGEFEAAEIHLRRAVELNPNDADALCFMGIFLSQTGKADESIACFMRAMRLNPYYPGFYLWNLGCAYYNAKRYSEALIPLKEFVGRHPEFMRPRRALAATYAQLGRIDDARTLVDEILTVEPAASLRQERDVTLPQYKYLHDFDHWLEGLRKAGLPE